MENSTQPSATMGLVVYLLVALSVIVQFAHPAAAQGSFTRADDYSFIHPEANVIQCYTDTALDQLRGAWSAADSNAFVIAHFGDEHIQGDMFTGSLQEILHGERGDGGWGMVQPTSVVRTFSSVYYTSSHKGAWRYDAANLMTPSLPRGVSGMVAKTTDENAQITFEFQEQLPERPMRLQLFCESNNSFDMLWVSGDDTVVIQPSSMNAESCYIEVLIPSFDREFTLMCHKTAPSQSEFTFHGANLLSAKDSGLVYHSLGVEGSGYVGILNADLFNAQLSALDPDLIILDYSVAELKGRDILGPSTKKNISRSIAKINRVCPNATILLMSAQDMYRGKKENVAVTEEYSMLLQEIASEKGCLLYDWFWASGGRTRILDWRKRMLAGPNLISLTPRGYRLKAEMLGEALLVALNEDSIQPSEVEIEAFRQEQAMRLQEFQTLEVATSTTTHEVTASTTTIRAHSPPAVEFGSAVSGSNGSSTSNSNQKITHVVAEGEFLGTIAERYNVGLSKLMAWNGLTKESILAIGQQLTIYSEEGVPSSSSSSSSSKVIHTVKSGEILSVIAEKYNVGLSQVIGWNNITDAASLRIGQELTIYPGQSIFTSGSTSSSSSSSSSKVIHTVKSGEVLSVIAEKYNVGLSQVTGWNNITDAASLRIGQELTIYPGQSIFTSGSTSSSSSSSSSKVIHTVKSGEVLSVIAEKYNVGLSQVIGWNNIKDAASLRVGQELIIYPDQSNLE